MLVAHSMGLYILTQLCHNLSINFAVEPQDTSNLVSPRIQMFPENDRQIRNCLLELDDVVALNTEGGGVCYFKSALTLCQSVWRLSFLSTKAG